jgi:hypothetical protein
MRWGIGHWGIDQWGGVSVPRKLTWALEIDWDKDGVFDGVNEAQYMTSVATKTGRRQLLRSDGKGFEPVMIGEMEVRLEDEGRRFDPYYSSGPLYGMLTAGVAFRLRVVDEATGILYPVMKGTIEEPRPVSGRKREVVIRGYDGRKRLQAEVKTALQKNIKISDAIAMILTQAGWTDPTDIDAITDTMPYWWASGKTAFSEIMDLVDSSLGQFFIAADGTATYRSRNNSGSSVGSITSTDIWEGFGLQIPQPQAVIRNVITVNSRPRAIATNVELWRLQDVPSIGAGQTKTDIWANYFYNGQACPADNVTSPVPGTDFKITQNADGSGTDLTANCSYVMTKFADAAKFVSITNGSATPGYIFLLKVRGDALTTSSASKIVKKDTASIAQLRGEYPFELDTNWLQDTNFAIEVATQLRTFLSGSGRDFPMVKVRDIPAIQFGLGLFDRPLLDFPEDDINALKVLSYIEHKSITKHCDVIETELHFEPFSGFNLDNLWYFTAIFGTTTNFTL